MGPAQPHSLVAVDIGAVVKAMLDDRRLARYFLDLETGNVLPVFDEESDAAWQAIRDSLEYQSRYEPVPTLASPPAVAIRPIDLRYSLWLRVQALEWLASVERRHSRCFRAMGLHLQPLAGTG